MRRFLASAWFPLLMSLVLAGVTILSYVLLAPDGSAIGNSELQRAGQIAGWAIGPIAGLLSFIIAGLLNLIRRIVRLRKVSALHPLIVLLSILPWAILGWILTGEPLHTPFAIAVIEFMARELLAGSLAACILTVLLSIPLLFPKKR